MLGSYIFAVSKRNKAILITTINRFLSTTLLEWSALKRINKQRRNTFMIPAIYINLNYTIPHTLLVNHKQFGECGAGCIQYLSSQLPSMCLLDARHQGPQGPEDCGKGLASHRTIVITEHYEIQWTHNRFNTKHCSCCLALHLSCEWRMFIVFPWGP